MERGIEYEYLRNVGTYYAEARLISLNMSGVMKRSERR